MNRSRLFWLLASVALGVGGCIVVVEAPPTSTRAAIPTSTPPPSVTPAPSATALGVSTATARPSAAPPPTDTPPPSASTQTAAPSATLGPTPAPIFINSFSIFPPEIRPGETVTLTWDVVAGQATIYSLDAQGRLSDPHFEVPLTGTLAIATSELIRNHIDFVLFAYAGNSSAQAFVSARITCPDVWFFADPPPACPQSAPHYTQLQAQHFQHGIMLWTQWNDFIYILYADAQFSPRWDARPNAWFAGMPESDPALVPPAGLFQPVRGFGAAWRDEQATPGLRVRDRLGWATNQEFPVSGAAYQCDSAPKYNTCYITGPANVVIVLEPERSGWRPWTGPPPTP